jgi:NAD+ diphosphatase
MQIPLRISVYERYVPAVMPDHPPGTPAYWFVFSTNRLLIKPASASSGTVHIPMARTIEELGIRPTRTQYLGTFEGHPCYSAEAPPEAADPEGLSFIGLRALYGSMDEDLFYLAGRAVQIVDWDRNHQFCGTCGSRTVSSETERSKLCPQCGNTCYPRISPAVITAILKDNQILLAHARHFQGNMYSIIAGFVEPGETLEDCVKREIQEEVGIKVKNIRYFGSQQWPFPNSLMIGFFADYESGEIKVDGEEIEVADWFDADNLPHIPSEISIARKMIDWYVREYS